MATFQSLALSKYPLEAVFEATRDSLSRAIDHVDDIERVVCTHRVEPAPGTVELTNVWYSGVSIPPSIQSLVAPHMLVWTDHAVWTSEDHTCRWRITSHFFPDNVACFGTTRYESTMRGQGTRVALHGEVTVRAHRFLELPLARGLEEFVCALFPGALRKVVDGVSRYVADFAPASRIGPAYGIDEVDPLSRRDAG